MEQFARRPLTRRHYFPQHTAFLLREGNAKFGPGKSPSPQTTLRSEKENRPGSPCQSKIAKLLGCETDRAFPCTGHAYAVAILSERFNLQQPWRPPGQLPLIAEDLTAYRI